MHNPQTKMQEEGGAGELEVGWKTGGIFGEVGRWAKRFLPIIDGAPFDLRTPPRDAYVDS